MEITKRNNASSKAVQQKNGFFQPQGSSTFFGVAQKKSFFSSTAQPKQKNDHSAMDGSEGLSQLPSLSKKRDGGAADTSSPNKDQGQGTLVPYQFRQTKTKGGKSRNVANKLSPLVQLKMEGAFAQDFSNVKIHQNSTQAQKMGARAFAQGEEIHFASGEYQPDTTSGQELIAHELGHIVQNRRQQVKPTRETPDGTPINDDPQLEQEADRMAQKAVRYQVKKTDIEQQSAPRNRSNVTQAKMLVQMNPIMGANYENEGKDTDENETSDYQEGNGHTGGDHDTNEGDSTNGEVDDNQSSGKTGGSKSRGGGKPKDEENEDNEGGEGSTNEEKEGAGAGTDDSSAGNGNEGGAEDTGDGSGNGENTDTTTGTNGEGQGEANTDDNSEENANNEGVGTEEPSTGENDTPTTDTKTAEAGAAGNFLREAANPFFQKALDKIEALADTHQKTSPANLKRQQAEKAVVPSTKEGQSKADAKRVKKVGDKPKPTTNKQKAKSDFDSKLKGSLPEKVKDVDDFKGSGKAKKIGKAAVDVVAVDKNSVIGTYGEMKNRPAPENLSANTVALPPLEKAAETPPLNLGENMIAELKPEHTDFSNYKKDVDGAMEKEGLTKEHLEEVTSGDLLALKEHQSEIETTADKAPEEIQQVRTAEITKMNESLSAEEAAERQDMQNQRNQELQNAQEQQVKAKSELEVKREQVSGDINKIYENAQQQVSQKLDGLEQESFKKFEEGQKQATQIFEQNIDNRIKAFKKERYTKKNGKFKKVKWLIDCVLGINRFDEVKRILDEERTRFVDSINQLIDNITSHNETVIKECRDIVENTRLEIATYVDGLPESLRSIGEAAEENIQKELDELEEKIALQEQELQEKLATKKEEAIAAIDKAIEERKKKMDGLLAKCVNILFNAALKYIRWALELVGIDPEPIIEMITKIKDGIMTIMREPKVFFKNLGQAVGGGFKQFGSDAGQYLKDVVFQWLGKKVGATNIKFPEKFDLKGILGLVTSALGLSWGNIKSMFSEFLGGDFVSKVESGIDFVKGMMQDGPAHLKELGIDKIKEKLAEEIGQEKVDKIFMAVDLVKSIAKDGISAVVDFVKEQAADLKSMVSSKVGEIKANVIKEIKGFIKQKIIQEGIKQILSMVTPATGIAKAVQGIFKVIQFFREEKDALKDLFKTIGQALGLVFKGDPGGASALIFDGILKAIPILLSFIVKILNLDGVFKKVKDVIGSVRKGVDDFLKNVVKWVSKIVKNVWEKIKGWFKKIKEKAQDKLSGKNKNEEEVPDYADPEKKAKVVEALDKLDEEQEQYLEGGKIRKKDAKKAVKTIKASEEGQIFSKLKVIKSEDGKRWDYLWAASPSHVHPGKYAIEEIGDLTGPVGKIEANNTKKGKPNEKENVTKVQQILCANGFSVEVDGGIGPETRGAIDNFQILVLRIDPTTVINPNDSTWTALKNQQGLKAQNDDSLKICGDVKNGVKNRDARIVQYWLFQNKVAEFPTLSTAIVDGDAGPKTDRAIRSFQNNKVKKDFTAGVVAMGDATWQKLIDGAVCTMDLGTAPSGSVGRDAENLQENVAIVENNLILCHALKASDKVSGDHCPGTSIPAEKLKPLINAISDFQTRYMANANCNSGVLEMGDETYNQLLEVQTVNNKLQSATASMSTGEVLEAIWNDPTNFIQNAGTATEGGFNSFFTKVQKEPESYLGRWLQSQLGGVDFPETWDLKGVLGVGIKLLDEQTSLPMSKEDLRDELEIKFGAPAVEGVMATSKVVMTALKEGPQAALNEIGSEFQVIAQEIKNNLLNSVKDWLIGTLLTKALTEIVKLFIPGAGFLKTVQVIYTMIETIIQKAQQLRAMVDALTSSASDLIQNNPGPAAKKVFGILDELALVAISFIANFVNLTNVTGEIKKLVKKVGDKIEKIYIRVKEFIFEKVSKFVGGGKDGKKQEGDNSESPTGEKIIGTKLEFNTTEGKEFKTHKLYAVNQNGTAEVIVRSAPTIVLHKLINWKGELSSLPKDKQSKASSLIESARKQYRVTKMEAQKSLENKADGLHQEELKLLPMLQSLFELYGEPETARPILFANTQIVHDVPNKESKAFVTKHRKGSEKTTDKTPGWGEAVVLNAYKNGTYWDKAHKVSHRLGGKGSNPANLFIGPKKFNKDLAKIEHQSANVLEELINLSGQFKGKENIFKDKILFYKLNYNAYNKPYDNFPNEVFISYGTCDADGKIDTKNDLVFNPTSVKNLTSPANMSGQININDISEKTIIKVVKKLLEQKEKDKTKALSYSFCEYLKDYSRRPKKEQKKDEYRFTSYKDVSDKLKKARNEDGITGIDPDTLDKELTKLYYLVKNEIVIIEQ